MQNENIYIISIEIAKQGKFDEAINYAKGIDIKYWRDITFKKISLEFSKKENWVMAEKTVLKIWQKSEIHDCWKEIAKKTIESLGMKNAMLLSNNFLNSESKYFYLKSIANFAITSECNSELILIARGYYLEDIDSLEKLLYQYSLNEYFFNRVSEEKINRFKRTLNIQWAFDIIENK